MRGDRRLVLFLRRFGHLEATTAATAASAKTIGRSWRLVTLDDAAVAPLGVAPGSAAYGSTRRALRRFARALRGKLLEASG